MGPLVVGSTEGDSVGRFVGGGEMVGASVSRCFPASVVPSKSNKESSIRVKDDILISWRLFMFPIFALLSRQAVESPTRIVVSLCEMIPPTTDGTI